MNPESGGGKVGSRKKKYSGKIWRQYVFHFFSSPSQQVRPTFSQWARDRIIETKKTLRVCFPSHLSSKLIKVGTEAKKLSLAYLFPLIWPHSSYLSIDKESLLLWMRSFGIKKGFCLFGSFVWILRRFSPFFPFFRHLSSLMGVGKMRRARSFLGQMREARYFPMR